MIFGMISIFGIDLITIAGACIIIFASFLLSETHLALSGHRRKIRELERQLARKLAVKEVTRPKLAPQAAVPSADRPTAVTFAMDQHNREMGRRGTIESPWFASSGCELTDEIWIAASKADVDIGGFLEPLEEQYAKEHGLESARELRWLLGQDLENDTETYEEWKARMEKLDEIHCHRSSGRRI